MCGLAPQLTTLPRASSWVQELEARVVKVIEDYKNKLVDRTEHHMG